MARISPNDAAAFTHGAWIQGRPQTPLTSFAIDSRVLEPGQTFIALKTERRDGHAYLGHAWERGAIAAIVEQPDHSREIPQLVVEDCNKSLLSMARFWRQRFSLPVIAVTGSYGKTTVKEMLGSALGSQWFRTRGNLNNTLGVPLSILELDSHHDAGAILEAGINQKGEMEVLAELLDPDLVIITAIGPAHLEMLGDLEGVAREKARLARAVRPGGAVVMPATLLRFSAIRDLLNDVPVHAIAIGPVGEEEREWSRSSTCTLHRYNWTDVKDANGMGMLQSADATSRDRYLFPAGSPGMVSNLALVVHTALHLGVPVHSIQACLEEWKPFHHRGETYRDPDRRYYVDCYNANPASMLDSVARFQNLFRGEPHLYLFGSMNELGIDSTIWHRKTGESLHLPGKARVILVGHGAGAMRDGLLATGFPEAQLSVVEDLDAIRHQIRAFSGAVFLKASRSFSFEQLLPEGAERC